MSRSGIDRDFFDIQTYAVYSAINRLFGKEATQKVIDLFGELVWTEIKKEIRIETQSPYDVMQNLAKYLREVGYITGLDIEKVSDREFIVTFHKGAAAYNAVMKLKAEKAPPPHYLTTTMSAAMRDIFGLKLNLMHTELDTAKKNYEARERWILTRI
jgi:hypothetical protein